MSNINELYTRTPAYHFYNEVSALKHGIKRKIVFVDYDDTLFVWNHSNSNYKRNIMYQHVAGENPYSAVGCMNKYLISALTECKNDSVIIPLSHVPTSMELEFKKEMIETLCPDLFDAFIGTDGPDSKIKVMDTFTNVYGIDNKSIVLIDDRWETLHNARESGFLGKTPTEVMLNGVW